MSFIHVEEVIVMIMRIAMMIMVMVMMNDTQCHIAQLTSDNGDDTARL